MSIIRIWLLALLEYNAHEHCYMCLLDGGCSSAAPYSMQRIARPHVVSTQHICQLLFTASMHTWDKKSKNCAHKHMVVPGVRGQQVQTCFQICCAKVLMDQHNCKIAMQSLLKAFMRAPWNMKLTYSVPLDSTVACSYPLHTFQKCFQICCAKVVVDQ